MEQKFYCKNNNNVNTGFQDKSNEFGEKVAKKSLPVLFSVVENWDVDDNSEKREKKCENVHLDETPNSRLAKKSQSAEDRYLSSTRDTCSPIGKKDHSVAYRMNKTERRFELDETAMDYGYGLKNQLKGVKNLPKMSQRSARSIDESELKYKQIKTRNGHWSHDQPPTDSSWTELSDPKPSFAPLRRIESQKIDRNKLNSTQCNEKFRIYTPAEVFRSNETRQTKDKTRVPINKGTFTDKLDTERSEPAFHQYHSVKNTRSSSLKSTSSSEDCLPTTVISGTSTGSTGRPESAASKCSSRSSVEYNNVFCEPPATFTPVTFKENCVSPPPLPITQTCTNLQQTATSGASPKPIVPQVFNIYQQYEQYGLEDDFEFPSISESAELSALMGHVRSLSIMQNSNGCYVNAETENHNKPSKNLYNNNQSLFSDGPF